MGECGRTALITGTGRNIGYGCAVELAHAGFNIVVNGARDRDACERVADEIRAIGTDALVVMADIGDRSAVDTRVDSALRTFRRIDVLVNNAAIRPATPYS